MLSIALELSWCVTHTYARGCDTGTLARRQCYEIQCQQDGGWYHVRLLVFYCFDIIKIIVLMLTAGSAFSYLKV